MTVKTKTPRAMGYKEMTREERARLLERDFLDRDGETYVRIRKEGRIGWEDSLPKGAAYSSAIMSPKSDKELLTNATRLARQMITAMDTPYRVNVYINSNKSLTDSKSVFVATEVFDDGDLTLGQKLDTFLGLAIHEGSHLLYTDFEALDKKADKLTRLIQNILEDEMIERKLGERKPGLANFLTAAKYYHFGRYERKKEEENVPSDPIARLFNAILATVRYPAALTEEMRDEFGAELLEIRDILTPYPERTADTMEKAKEILEVMRRFMAERQERQGGDGKDGQQQPGEDKRPDRDRSDGEGNEDNGSPGGGGGTPDEDNRETGSPEGESGDTDKSPVSHEPDSGALPGSEPTHEEMEKALEGTLRAAAELTCDPAGEGENPLRSEDMASAAKAQGHLLARECDGELETGQTPGTVIIRQEPDRGRYMDSLSRVRRHIPTIAAALRLNNDDYRYNITGLRSGLLDTNRLAEARQGVQTVHMRKGRMSSDRTGIALVIDESGSMRGTRETLARDTAVLVNEAVGNIPGVTLHIYGYSSGGNGAELYPYREGAAPDNKYRLGAITSRGCTPTAQAILEAAARVRARGNGDKTVMLVISDGNADTGPRPVREAVDGIRRMNIEVIGVSVSSDLDQERLGRMYDNWIMMDDLPDLASRLARTVKEAILRNSVRHHNI